MRTRSLFALSLVALSTAAIASRTNSGVAAQYPVGIDWVLVNGTAVVAEGKFTDARPGRVLKHVPARP